MTVFFLRGLFAVLLSMSFPALVFSQVSAVREVANEFIFTEAPFPSCHASTIAETPEGLVAAWFGGTHEGNPDVEIWSSRLVNGKWTQPVSVANGIQHSKKRYPTWNPVLYQVPGGPLLLFYKVGRDVPTWWGEMKVSNDNGKTWSEARRLPEDIYGPIKNKPFLTKDGILICPASTEDDGWRVQMELTRDFGKTWEVVKLSHRFNAIQGSILEHPNGQLQALHRTRESRIAESWSTDGGKTWSQLELTGLPNNNSGTDAVTLKNGWQALIYNHTDARQRTPLNLAVSKDGKNWRSAWIFEKEPGEYSYPAVIQAKDGKVHFTYTWKRQRVKHVVLDLEKVDFEKLKPITGISWPE